MIDYLTLQDLLTIAEKYHLLPVRDLGLLDSAAHRPLTSLFGDDAYPELTEKAAVLLESLVRNHPLIDGNKRLGWIATVIFLERNSMRVEAEFDAAYDLVIAVATGVMDYHESAARLAAWTSTST
ncbi:type II toxin-antitoxin system death-on-curing family toxin [Aeromicrobium sp. CF3.5]|uniref:type II toxin-antitoxin system death-on-curing family toxin n=1 Tax=Aeromicrobium sp. CF3.5 TaxID=3373078 RepID=UPI003EE70339